MQFLLLGALLYGASVLHARLNDPRRIVIANDDVARLEQRYRQQFGASPSAAQLEWLIARHARDEVLYREGLALGLGEGDEVVRRRIVQKMEFLSEGDAPVAEPTDAEMRAFYDAHRGRYRSAARVSFVQLYFSTDAGGEAAARGRATRALARLQSGRAAVEAVAADPFWESERVERADRQEVERAFGHSELAARVFELPAGAWCGPLRSGYGWHLVRIETREPPRLAPLAEVEPEVQADWQQEQRARHQREAFERLMRSYEVVREKPAERNARTAGLVASAGQ